MIDHPPSPSPRSPFTSDSRPPLPFAGSERVDRVLIVVPEALLHQWLVEMLRRFNLRFSLFDNSRLEEGHEDEPFDNEQLVLAPFSLFATSSFARAMALEAEWDMVVVDDNALTKESVSSSAIFLVV